MFNYFIANKVDHAADGNFRKQEPFDNYIDT